VPNGIAADQAIDGTRHFNNPITQPIVEIPGTSRYGIAGHVFKANILVQQNRDRENR
jgi:hypothetical protein